MNPRSIDINQVKLIFSCFRQVTRLGSYCLSKLSHTMFIFLNCNSPILIALFGVLPLPIALISSIFWTKDLSNIFPKFVPSNFHLSLGCFCGPLFLFFAETVDVFIFNHGSTTNIGNNKNYMQIHRPPSDDYKHWSKPKARRHHRLSLAGARHRLL